jgi:hypothetical protein
MAIISKQTLGDIVIYETDDFPDFLANEGDLCISKDYGLLWLYVDNDWVALKLPNAFQNAIDTTTQTWDVGADLAGFTTLGAANTTWLSSFNSTNFTFTGGNFLRYDGEVPARIYLETHASIENNSRWSVNRLTLAKQNQSQGGLPLLSPTVALAQSIPAITTTGVTNYTSRIIDLFKDDQLIMGRNSLQGDTGGSAASRTISLRNASYFAKVIDQGKVTSPIFVENWESGSFATNGWTVVNGTQTNQWVVGTATAASGSFSAYISNNGGVSNAYTITSSSIVHIYIDINIPADTSIIVIEFDWKGLGENAAGDDQYDYGRIYWAPTSLTPVAGTAVPVANRIGAIKYNNVANFTPNRITVPVDSGFNLTGTQRLIISWINDASVGTQPPLAIDNIVVRGVKF